MDMYIQNLFGSGALYGKMLDLGLLIIILGNALFPISTLCVGGSNPAMEILPVLKPNLT